MPEFVRGVEVPRGIFNTVVGTVIAAGIVGAIGLLVADSEDPETPRTVQPTSSGLGGASGASSATPTVERFDCRDARGDSVPCSASHATRVIGLWPCTVTTIGAHYGVPAGRTLDMSVDGRPGGGCSYRVGELGRAAGATTQTLENALTGHYVDPSVLVCATDDETPVACSQPHTKEVISPWRETSDQQALLDECSDVASVYTGERTSRGGGDLKVALQGHPDKPSTYRCVIGSTVNMVDSVFGVGGGPLPTSRYR